MKKERLQAEEVLQAVILCSDLTKSVLNPISKNRPSFLLPCLNSTLLGYTLDFLLYNNVREIFLICSSYAPQYETYIQDNFSPFGKSYSKLVKVISSSFISTPGEALRELDSLGKIRSDPFILLNGPIIANIKLQIPLSLHKNRRRKDKNCIMSTIFIEEDKHYDSAKSLENDLVIVLDNSNGQLLRYENTSTDETIFFPNFDSLKYNRDQVIRYDLYDTHIDLCSPEMLLEVAGNYDYQYLRKDYLHNEVQNNDLGFKFFSYVYKPVPHETVEEHPTCTYAQRVTDFFSYQKALNAILARKTYPLVADNSHYCTCSFESDLSMIYESNSLNEDNLNYAKFEGNCFVGAKFLAEFGSKVSNSVIGNDCLVAQGSQILNSVLGNEVKLGENVKILKSLIGEEVEIAENCIIEEYCVIGSGIKISEGTRISSFSILISDPENDYNYKEVKLEVDDMQDDDENEEKIFLQNDGFVPGWALSSFQEILEQSLKLNKNQVAKQYNQIKNFSPARLRKSKQDRFSDGTILKYDFDLNELDDDENDDDKNQKFVLGIKHIFDEIVQTDEERKTSVIADNFLLELNCFKYAENRTTLDSFASYFPFVLSEGFRDQNLQKHLRFWKTTLLSILNQDGKKGEEIKLSLFDSLEFFFVFGANSVESGQFHLDLLSKSEIEAEQIPKKISEQGSHFPKFLLEMLIFFDETEIHLDETLGHWFRTRSLESSKRRFPSVPNFLVSLDLTKKIVQSKLEEESDSSGSEEESSEEEET
eukprot:snap_masked-scaffold_14-processed-gene-0.7-mRNA-1 protein AED:1.00 eAED:1.00 QI:0/-1/0/0/-1/1/1/0/761